MREQKAGGTLTGAWSLDHPGAVLMLEVPDAAAAARLLAGFPLVEAALITTEIIPLHPIDLLLPAAVTGGPGSRRRRLPGPRRNRARGKSERYPAARAGTRFAAFGVPRPLAMS